MGIGETRAGALGRGGRRGVVEIGWGWGREVGHAAVGDGAAWDGGSVGVSRLRLAGVGVWGGRA